MRVLLTTDGSSEATKAMRAACRLLTDTDREVHVLHVAAEPRRPKSGKIPRRIYQQRVTEHTKAVLEQAKGVLAEEGVDALTLCQSGSPAAVLIREAEQYDLTVIGARGVNARSEVGLGPIASRLVEHGSGCVLVARNPPGERQFRVLVPVDGSEGSEQALDALASMFDIDSAEIKLLHVVETLWLPMVDEPGTGASVTPESIEADQIALELRREAEELLNEARGRISSHHPGISLSIREGVPANEILAEADQGDYDLVAVGATSAADMKHKFLGSVSSKVAWNAPCSVLVVRVRA